jgi:hypothetical protein
VPCKKSVTVEEMCLEVQLTVHISREVYIHFSRFIRSYHALKIFFLPFVINVASMLSFNFLIFLSLCNQIQWYFL